MPLRKKNIQAEIRRTADHDIVYHVRTRLTIAEVNANTILLPALSNGKYALVDASLIAEGGAAATQPVRVTGVQAGVTVDLVNDAVAGLTQNTLLRAGAANSAILAAGASFAACDKNTPIRANSAGVTGATHIHFNIAYRIEGDSLLSST